MNEARLPIGDALRLPGDAETPVGDAFRLPRDEVPPPVRKRNRLPLEDYTGAKVYSLTICTSNRQPVFTDHQVVKFCFRELEELSTRNGALVYAFCFMPDHLHLLIGSNGDLDLIGFVKLFKQKTGWWYRERVRGSLKASPTGESLPLWQKSYYDHVVRSEESLRTIAEYVLLNPVRAGLAGSIGEYPFAGSLVWRELGPADLMSQLS